MTVGPIVSQVPCLVSNLWCEETERIVRVLSHVGNEGTRYRPRLQGTLRDPHGFGKRYESLNVTRVNGVTETCTIKEKREV